MKKTKQSFKYFWVQRRGIEVPVLVCFDFTDKTFSEGGHKLDDVLRILEPVARCETSLYPDACPVAEAMTWRAE